MLRAQITCIFAISVAVQYVATSTDHRAANAALLFPGARQPGANHTSEIGVMAASGDDEKHSHTILRRYTAVLTVPGGIGSKWVVAAKGQRCESVIAALQSLFEVTATALEKFQGNLLKSSNSLCEIADGLVDESLLKHAGNGPWTSLFGS